MGKQVSLTDLYAKPEHAAEPAAGPQPATVRDVGVGSEQTASERAEPQSTPPRPRGRTSASDAPAGIPKYLQLVRKEARLSAEQFGELTALSRRLNADRRGSGERITENTLIRVAIDVLLARADAVAGTTEAELRKSVGL